MQKNIYDYANKIIKQIEKIDMALNCFEYEHKDEAGNIIEIFDLKPKLKIVHLDSDFDGMTETEIPINLNYDLINILKSHLQEAKKFLEREFELL